ncbi:MAG: hypothetical protein U0X92_12295, partial [Anaerolineales bacterium]
MTGNFFSQRRTKRIASITFGVVFLLSSFLVACSPAPSPTPTAVLPTPKLIFPTQAPICTTLEVEPTPGPEEPSLFPPESADDHARGATNPSVTITTYVDYQ